MTIRELYDYALIEMNKVEAPSLLLEDYNYFINKAVQQYINKVYNRYDINQQSTDDLRVLKATVQLDLTKQVIGKININKDKFVYSVDLPENYMHLLNCIVVYKVKKQFKCYNANDIVEFPAKRLTSDLSPAIIHNAYMRPDYKRPYYFINNVNAVLNATDPVSFDSRTPSPDSSIPTLTDEDSSVNPMKSNYSGSSLIGKYSDHVDSVKPEDTRTSNVSKVRMEIRIGNDDSVFEPQYVYIDYIKSPMFIRITQDEVDATEDTTRILEFPDYACYEIVNEFVKLLMENASDPRLQSNYTVNQTVADPTAVTQSNSRQDKS